MIGFVRKSEIETRSDRCFLEACQAAHNIYTQGFMLLIILHSCRSIWRRYYQGMLLYFSESPHYLYDFDVQVTVHRDKFL